MPALASVRKYPVVLDHLLPGFVRRNPAVERQFHDTARPYLMGLSQRLAPFLPAELHEDVVHQALVLLMTAPGMHFNPAKGSARAFLRLMVRRAVRDFCATSVAPGRRTRAPK